MAVNAIRGNDGLRANCRAGVLQNGPTHGLQGIILIMNICSYVVSILSVVFIKPVWRVFGAASASVTNKGKKNRVRFRRTLWVFLFMRLLICSVRWQLQSFPYWGECKLLRGGSVPGRLQLRCWQRGCLRHSP